MYSLNTKIANCVPLGILNIVAKSAFHFVIFRNAQAVFSVQSSSPIRFDVMLFYN